MPSLQPFKVVKAICFLLFVVYGTVSGKSIQSFDNASWSNNEQQIIAHKKELEQSIASGNWAKAEHLIHLTDELLNASENIILKKEWIQLCFEYYKQKGEMLNARLALEEISNYNDQVYNVTIQEKIEQLNKVSKHKRELELQAIQIAKEIEISKHKKLVRFLILISIITGLLSWVLWSVYKNEKAKIRQFLNKQELLSSQMTPHFIFNCLSIVQGMVLNKEFEKASKYIAKFSNILKFITKEQTQAFVPIKEEVSSLVDYVDLQNLSTDRKIDFKLHIDESLVEKTLIPPMLLQPFIENAIIHGFAKDIETPLLNIDFKGFENKLRCVITDNGVGLKATEKGPSKSKSSLATKIVSERLAILSKKMRQQFSVTVSDVKQTEVTGVEVTLMLPFKIKKEGSYAL